MIANLELQEIVLYSMMQKIDKILGIGSVMYFAVPLDMTAIGKKSLLSGGEWTLAAEEQGLHGRGSCCRCHSYGCGSEEQCRKHDRKYWCPEYEFFPLLREAVLS